MPKQQDTNYIDQHFQKLDKELKNIHKAYKATDMLAQSITLMDQLKKYKPHKKDIQDTEPSDNTD